MSNWLVHLEFEEGSSSKFWRARIEDGTLYVNYGRIGSNGQMQLKELGDDEACQAELDKLEKEKRRKGYVDAEGFTPPGKAAAKAAPAPKPAAAKAAPAKVEPAAPQLIDLALDVGGRKIELRLASDGTRVRTVVVEQYADASTAQQAFERLREAMQAEGYKKVATRADL